jgi:hypothetical protein
VREAGFPRPKRLQDFDYAANPNTPEQVNTLADPAWVTAGQPLCLIGDSGTGKSHLLIGIGTAIAEAGMRVRYTTTANLVNELAEAADEKKLARTTPATAASTCSAWTNWATSTATRPEPSCCSRSSPNARNDAPSRSPPTRRSPSGSRPSPTRGSARPS